MLCIPEIENDNGMYLCYNKSEYTEQLTDLWSAVSDSQNKFIPKECF